MVNKFLAATGVAIVLIIGWAGWQLWQAGGVAAIDHTRLSHSRSMHIGDHTALISVPAGPNAPTLDFEFIKDGLSGWNLHILVENFTFAPEAVNDDHVDGQGHAHLFIEGKKLARIYGPWFHVPTLPFGNVMIEVTLNSNTHHPLAVGETQLHQAKTFMVK